MNAWITANQQVIAAVLLNACLALSQYVVLRAGVFSVATVGLAAVGAYTAGILTVHAGWPFWPGLVAAIVLSLAASMLLGALLARLRGVYQALATLGFVTVLQTVIINAQGLTGGADGTNGIPKHVGAAGLLISVVVVVSILSAVGRGRIGRAFSAIRQDELAAAMSGISVYSYQMVAFALSGAIAGLAGGLAAYNTYSVVPSSYSFSAVIAVLAYAVLGGTRSAAGPLVGAAILTLLPLIDQSLALNAPIIEGVLIILMIRFLPRGIVDSIVLTVRTRYRRYAQNRTESLEKSAHTSRATADV